MDVAHIAGDLTLLLAPMLPYLTTAGKSFSDGVLKRAGGDTFDLVKTKVWDRLRPKLDQSPEASFALKQLAQRPQSVDYRDSFANVLKDLLSSDQHLTAELQAFLQSGVVQTILAEKTSRIIDASQEASGEGSTQQKIIATENSMIRGVRQKKT